MIQRTFTQFIEDTDSEYAGAAKASKASMSGIDRLRNNHGKEIDAAVDKIVKKHRKMIITGDDANPLWKEGRVYQALQSFFVKEIKKMIPALARNKFFDYIAIQDHPKLNQKSITFTVIKTAPAPGIGGVKERPLEWQVRFK